MGINTKQPFANLAALSAPESVRYAVRERIARSQKRAFLSRLALSIATEIASVIAVIASFSYISQSLASSGVYEYVRLILSEGVGLFAYSKELGLSIIESLPVLAIACLLAAFLSFGWSTIRLMRQSRPSVARSSTLYA